jgi:hypothetical protein
MRHEQGTIRITKPTSISPTVNSVVFTDSEGMRCIIELGTLIHLTEIHKIDMVGRKIDYDDLIDRTMEQYLKERNNEKR